MNPMGLPMGGMPMMMPMMGLPVGMPMMGFAVGMPMAPLVAGGVAGMGPMAAAVSQGTPSAAAPSAARSARAEAEEKKAQLLKDLEEANAELSSKKEAALVWDRAKRKWALASVASSGSKDTSSSGPGGAEGAQDRERDTEVGEGSGSASTAATTKNTEEDIPRCHLHSQKKPNAKCKFCQRAQGRSGANQERAAAPQGKATPSASSQAPAPSRGRDAEGTGVRRAFSCSPMLRDQVVGSSYFRSLLSIDSLEDLIEEIVRYADSLDVYNPGSNVSPSNFICQVYRLFTMTEADDVDEIRAVVEHASSAVVRCVGFLYIRFVMAPTHLWEMLEEYLFDDMELKHADGAKQAANTIGKYVEALLASDKYYGTPLPRIPARVRQTLERELAPLREYRKRMEANLHMFRTKNISELPIEVYMEGSWVPATAKEFVGRASLRRRVLVHLGSGEHTTVHSGKLVLREQPEASGSESGSEDRGRRRLRSRSRSRRRGSPDWSRWKGSGEAEMLEEFRERAREGAVCAHGKSYSRRPLTMEEELWKKDPEARVSLLGEDTRSSFRRTAPVPEPRESSTFLKMRAEEEQEHQRRMRDIYEKYGSTARASAQTSAARTKDIDEPDVLRFG